MKKYILMEEIIIDNEPVLVLKDHTVYSEKERLERDSKELHKLQRDVTILRITAGWQLTSNGNQIVLSGSHKGETPFNGKSTDFVKGFEAACKLLEVSDEYWQELEENE